MPTSPDHRYFFLLIFFVKVINDSLALRDPTIREEVLQRVLTQALQDAWPKWIAGDEDLCKQALEAWGSDIAACDILERYIDAHANGNVDQLKVAPYTAPPSSAKSFLLRASAIISQVQYSCLPERAGYIPDFPFTEAHLSERLYSSIAPLHDSYSLLPAESHLPSSLHQILALMPHSHASPLWLALQHCASPNGRDTQSYKHCQTCTQLADMCNWDTVNDYAPPLYLVEIYKLWKRWSPRACQTDGLWIRFLHLLCGCDDRVLMRPTLQLVEEGLRAQALGLSAKEASSHPGIKVMLPDTMNNQTEWRTSHSTIERAVKDDVQFFMDGRRARAMGLAMWKTVIWLAALRETGEPVDFEGFCTDEGVAVVWEDIYVAKLAHMTTWATSDLSYGPEDVVIWGTMSKEQRVWVATARLFLQPLSLTY